MKIQIDSQTIQRMIEVLQESVIHTDEVLSDKSQSPSYCFGYMQGCTKQIIRELNYLITEK